MNYNQFKAGFTKSTKGKGLGITMINNTLYLLHPNVDITSVKEDKLPLLALCYLNQTIKTLKTHIRAFYTGVATRGQGVSDGLVTTGRDESWGLQKAPTVISY